MLARHLHPQPLAAAALAAALHLLADALRLPLRRGCRAALAVAVDPELVAAPHLPDGVRRPRRLLLRAR